MDGEADFNDSDNDEPAMHHMMIPVIIENEVITIIIKFISQHNKVKQNNNNRKKIEILAEWPTQDETMHLRVANTSK